MPELPEVETTRRQLEPVWVGRTIKRIQTTAPSYFFLTAPSVLNKSLPGKTARTLHRHGKYMWVEFEDASSLLLHLGMTGQIFPAGSNAVKLISEAKTKSIKTKPSDKFEPDKHIHVVFFFEDNGPPIFFRDTRKFGKIEFSPSDVRSNRLKGLGVDALVATASVLIDAAKSRKSPIKTMLLDQSVIAGVGNIYADEALFHAKIHPQTPANQISIKKYSVLMTEIQRVLEQAIEAGGSSINDYVAPHGEGKYQNEVWVYGRTGDPCRSCTSPITRIVIGQRSTHFCSRCQK